jgi:hypothetical protein
MTAFKSTLLAAWLTDLSAIAKQKTALPRGVSAPTPRSAARIAPSPSHPWDGRLGGDDEGEYEPLQGNCHVSAADRGNRF